MSSTPGWTKAPSVRVGDGTDRDVSTSPTHTLSLSPFDPPPPFSYLRDTSLDDSSPDLGERRGGRREGPHISEDEGPLVLVPHTDTDVEDRRRGLAPHDTDVFRVKDPTLRSLGGGTG